MSTCKDKVCFCADPQWISDETDRCMLALGTIDGMYSADTYNGIMAFFANECGTFQAQFKSVASQSIVYSTVYAQAPAPTPTGQAQDPGGNVNNTGQANPGVITVWNTEATAPGLATATSEPPETGKEGGRSDDTDLHFASTRP
ncbi:hypothetical protein VTJ04DRAFT_2088 [Mycothermus thermophilus]|uniref:uncharacterized protein n=1 Tax=Humicola insolens TaxID=85995 RepID=UPI0037439E38